MKVLIHALGTDIGGGVRHLSNLLPALSRSKTTLSSKPEYIVLLRKKISIPPLSKSVSLLRIPNFLGANVLARLLIDNLILPVFLKVKGIETVVTLSNFGPLWGVKNHINFQNNALYFNRWYFHQLSSFQKLLFSLRKTYFFLIMDRAHKVVVPSHTMLAVITQTFPNLDPEKFIVLPYASEQPEIGVAPVPKRLVEIWGNAPVNFFYPSHLMGYKGFDILFRALGKLKRIHGHQFRCLLPVSLDEWPEGSLKLSKILTQEGLKNDVMFLGRLSYLEMDYLYRNVTAVVFPSLIESFGFPLVEALSYNLPVIASDTPINREICQNGARYYPPFDSEAMAIQLKAIYDADIRQQLSQEAKSQYESRDWSWGTYAREFEKIL